MRSYIEKRNALILALSNFVGCPVLMASQVEPEMEPPFIVYSITSAADHHHVVYCLQYQPS